MICLGVRDYVVVTLAVRVCGGALVASGLLCRWQYQAISGSGARDVGRRFPLEMQQEFIKNM